MTRRMVAAGLAVAAITGFGGSMASADSIYGISQGGQIYKIDSMSHDEIPLGDPLGNNGNGLAMDEAGNRLLFRVPSTEQNMQYMDLSDNSVGTITLDKSLSGIDTSNAAFYDGSYWFVANNTNKLYQVAINNANNTGTVTNLGSITGSPTLGFGDVAIVIQNGTLYGSSSQGLFSLNMANPTSSYTVINSSTPMLQIALLQNGTLIGQTYAGVTYNSTHYGAGQWFQIDPTSGDATAIDGFKTTPLRDLASGGVPEPSSIALLGLGVGASLAFARRRAKVRV